MIKVEKPQELLIALFKINLRADEKDDKLISAK